VLGDCGFPPELVVGAAVERMDGVKRLEAAGACQKVGLIGREEEDELLMNLQTKSVRKSVSDQVRNLVFSQISVINLEKVFL
jgi:hypothetical protein